MKLKEGKGITHTYTVQTVPGSVRVNGAKRGIRVDS